jgi:hypothetical protein
MDFGMLRIPFSGGLYLRVLPYTVIDRFLKKVNNNRSAMVYVHPWELDVNQPRMNAPLHIRMEHYCNLASTKGKLDKLFCNFSFAPLGQVIKSVLEKESLSYYKLG